MSKIKLFKKSPNLVRYLTCLLGLSVTAFGDLLEPPDFKNSQGVTIHGRYERLRTARWTANDTTILYPYVPQNRWIRKGARAVVIFLDGTGRRNGPWGAVSSFAEVANEAINLHMSPIALENPFYAGSQLSASERLPFLNKYKILRNQMNWFYGTLSYIVEHLPLDEEGNPVPIFLVGRSTGASLIAQAVHEYLEENARIYTADSKYQEAKEFDPMVMRYVKSVALTGFVGHTAADIYAWHGVTLKWLEADKEGRETDAQVIRRHPSLFKDFTYARDIASPVFDRRARLPRNLFPIHIVLGSRDDQSSLTDQERTAHRFFDQHPAFPVIKHYTDSRRHVGSSERYTLEILGETRAVDVNGNARFKNLLRTMRDQQALNGHGGLYETKSPEFLDYLRSCQHQTER